MFHQNRVNHVGNHEKVFNHRYGLVKGSRQQPIKAFSAANQDLEAGIMGMKVLTTPKVGIFPVGGKNQLWK